MANKSLELSEDDPLVKRFNSGLDKWEKPFDVEGPDENKSGLLRKSGTRGAVRTRGAGWTSEVDSLVELFEDGLDDWEKPFDKE